MNMVLNFMCDNFFVRYGKIDLIIIKHKIDLTFSEFI